RLSVDRRGLQLDLGEPAWAQAFVAVRIAGRPGAPARSRCARRPAARSARRRDPALNESAAIVEANIVRIGRRRIAERREVDSLPILPAPRQAVSRSILALAKAERGSLRFDRRTTKRRCRWTRRNVADRIRR